MRVAAQTAKHSYTICQARHLDRKHVVFGEILREDGQAGDFVLSWCKRIC